MRKSYLMKRYFSSSSKKTFYNKFANWSDYYKNNVSQITEIKTISPNLISKLETLSHSRLGFTHYSEESDILMYKIQTINKSKK